MNFNIKIEREGSQIEFHREDGYPYIKGAGVLGSKGSRGIFGGSICWIV
jgi:hypothetical protein